MSCCSVTPIWELYRVGIGDRGLGIWEGKHRLGLANLAEDSGGLELLLEVGMDQPAVRGLQLT